MASDLLRIQDRFASKLAPTENKAEISKSPAWKSPTVQVIGAMAAGRRCVPVHEGE